MVLMCTLGLMWRVVVVSRRSEQKRDDLPGCLVCWLLFAGADARIHGLCWCHGASWSAEMLQVYGCCCVCMLFFAPRQLQLPQQLRGFGLLVSIALFFTSSSIEGGVLWSTLIQPARKGQSNEMNLFHLLSHSHSSFCCGGPLIIPLSTSVLCWCLLLWIMRDTVDGDACSLCFFTPCGLSTPRGSCHTLCVAASFFAISTNCFAVVGLYVAVICCYDCNYAMLLCLECSNLQACSLV